MHKHLNPCKNRPSCPHAKQKLKTTLIMVTTFSYRWNKVTNLFMIFCHHTKMPNAKFYVEKYKLMWKIVSCQNVTIYYFTVSPAAGASHRCWISIIISWRLLGGLLSHLWSFFSPSTFRYIVNCHVWPLPGHHSGEEVVRFTFYINILKSTV